MDFHETRHRHAPCHRFVPHATYFITAGIYEKHHLLRSNRAKDIVLDALFQQTARFGWELHAWAVLSNHYHIVAVAPENAKTLAAMLDDLHSQTATAINALLNTPGRQIWYQYRDTCLTNERSYLARLNYVHCNPVKHGVVHDAALYKWCSMRWLQEQEDEEMKGRILAAPTDTINVQDDF